MDSQTEKNQKHAESRLKRKQTNRRHSSQERKITSFHFNFIGIEGHASCNMQLCQFCQIKFNVLFLLAFTKSNVSRYVVGNFEKIHFLVRRKR